MAICEPEIKRFLQEIQPTKTQLNGAMRSHKYLRHVLRSGNFENRIIRSYLSGSYLRGTAIYPLDDVDIIFEINPGYWKVPIFEKYPEPEVVLKSFHRAIKARYVNTPVRLQRRSVGLRLSHLDVDVVPAIPTRERDLLLIPDRSDNIWIPTGPKVHSDAGFEVNKILNKLFKPIVKLLKYWNSRLPSTTRTKSFTIETIAIRLFSNVQFETLQDGLKLYFDFLVFLGDGDSSYAWHTKYGMSVGLLGWLNVPDVASTGFNVASGMGRDRLRKFIVQAERSLHKMLAAERAVSTSAAWKRVSEALKIKT